MTTVRKYQPESKTELLCEQLKKMALERGPDAKLPATRELCAIFQTSHVMITTALNVLEAQNVVYRKARNGIFVSPKIYRKSIHILLSSSFFLAPMLSPFWGMLWGMLAYETRQRSKSRNEYYTNHLIYVAWDETSEMPEELSAAASAEQLHAVLAIGTDELIYNWCKEQCIPCISFAGPGHRMVAIDQREIIRLAIEALMQRGCRRLGLWIPAIDAQNREEMRIRYFKELLALYALPFVPELVRTGPLTLPGATSQALLQEQGLALALEVFDPHATTRPDGLVIVDDMMTEGALIGLERYGIRVGTEVRIATHANRGSSVLFGHTDQLIPVEIDPAAIVKTMLALLDEAFAPTFEIDQIEVRLVSPAVKTS